MDMIDLTGDSDEEEAEVYVPPKNKDAIEPHSGSNNATAAANKRSGDGPISSEEMRRLRLQKFTGAAKASFDQKPSANGGFSSASAFLAAANASASVSSLSRSKTEGKQSSGDIQPVQPTSLALSRSGRPMRYIIYMAVREGKQSQFAQGLELCKAACPEGMQSCLQMDGTRHCTVFDGNLTPDQVRNLSFDGDGFDPLEIEFEGWCPWDAGCYLQLTVESENQLQDLLDRVEGLPSGGKRPCNHLSLYRKRQQTRHPNPKREFAKIREATRSHDWGSVEGVSIRIKEMSTPYEECIVLANARPPKASSTLQSAEQSSTDDKPGLAEGSKAAEEKRCFRDHSNSDDSVLLSVVSWNLSEVSMSAVSNAAPCPIQRAQESPNLIREECLRPHLDAQKQNGRGGEAYLPDIVALQEVPDAGWSTAVFGPYGYVSKGTQHSHCGLVDLLVRKDWASTSIELWLDRIERNDHSAFDEAYQQELPSVAAIITLPNNTQVAVASNHLEPFTSGASARAHQCKCLMEALTKRCSNIIIIGDMNMRQKEDRTTERLVGGGWVDAWKDTGSRKDAKFTWNSFTNLYHLNGFGFTCRFDRCYAKGEHLSVKQFCLVGDQPVQGRAGDYLSDHYGIAVALGVKPTPLDDCDVKVGATNREKKVAGDRKPTATSRKQKEDSSSDSSSSGSSSSGSCGKLKSEGKCASSPDQAQENHHQYKSEEWSDDSVSADEITASQETRRIGNGRRVQSEADAAKKARADSKQESESPRGRQKKPVKRSRFDSSSSDDDDDEAFLHAVNKNLGRVTKKKPKRRHLLAPSSSDED